MPLATEIPLCDCAPIRCFAILDELTLTYDVVERRSEGAPRVLYRHIASLSAARARVCSLHMASSCPRPAFQPRP